MAQDIQVTEATTLPARHRKLRKKRQSPWWLDLLIGVLVAILLTAVVKAFVVQQFKIPSESMENTLVKGDHILVSEMKALQPVRRGDIVVFEDRHGWLPKQYKDDNPTGFDATALGQAIDKTLRFLRIRPEYPGGYLVKRVIGIGGDHVTCCNAKNQVEVNGVGLKENYLKDGANTMPFTFDVTVPKGKYWVMGDNRDNSGDSRYHQDDENHGFVDESQVVGRVLVRYFPLARWRTFPNPGLDKIPAATKQPATKNTKSKDPAKSTTQPKKDKDTAGRPSSSSSSSPSGTISSPAKP